MSDRIEKAAMASDETIEKAVEVVWECGPWTDQDSLRIVRALAEAGLLAPSPHIVGIAEGIRICGKTHGWRTRQGLAASMFQLVDLILGPDLDPPAPLMITTTDTDDWDY